MKKIVLFGLFIKLSICLVAQSNPPDTIKNYTLPEFIVRAKADPEYEKKYQRLVYNVKKVLPYAKLASFRFQMLEQNLQLLPNEKARKEYLKRSENSIKEQFMDDLMNLTVTQGKILIRLIYRETGSNAYDLLKTYRGNLTAMYWQTFAKFIGGNLKDEYDPVEDWQIEQIIKQMGFE
jgi:hypothetical protein